MFDLLLPLLYGLIYYLLRQLSINIEHLSILSIYIEHLLCTKSILKIKTALTPLDRTCE